MQKLICLDTETGGLDPKQHSLLSIGMLIVTLSDKGIEFSDPRQWFVKHDVYKVTSGALKVNKINIEDHDVVSKPWQTEVQPEIFEYLSAHGFDHKEKVAFLGHNVTFDIEFLKTNIKDLPYVYPKYDEGKLISINSLLDFISHRHVDTAGISRFLIQAGVFPKEASAKSDYLFERYKKEILDELSKYPLSKIAHSPGRHTALGDVIRTAIVYREMLKEVRSEFDLGYLQAVEDLS